MITTFLQLWQALGNDFPPAMVEVEAKLWKVLLEAVHNPISLPVLLQSALNNIDVDSLQEVDEAVKLFLQSGIV
jgi:hypothetical protein